MFAIPGDPARLLAGKNATPEKIAAIRAQLGLDKPLYVQYGKFVVRLVHGDLGDSYQLQRPVTEMIRENAPNTIQLAIAAVLIEMLGIPLGIYSALRQYTFWDTTLTTAALIIWGIPVFVLGLFMQWLFGFKLNLLPLIGAGDNVVWIIPGQLEQLRLADPAGRHAGPHRGRLHLVHAARLHARGHPRGLHPHGARQGTLREARSSPSTPSRTPSSPS